MVNIKKKQSVINAAISLLLLLLFSVTLSGCNSSPLSTDTPEISSSLSPSETVPVSPVTETTPSKLSSPTNSPEPTSSETTLAITDFNSTFNGVQFGLTPEEIVVAFKENNIKLAPNLLGVFPENGVNDGRSYTFKNPDFSYLLANEGPYNFEYTHKGGYYYHEDGTFSRFASNYPAFSTNEGIKIGDDYNRMVEVYGENYYLYLNYPRIYTYFNGSEYLFLAFANDKIAVIAFTYEDIYSKLSSTINLPELTNTETTWGSTNFSTTFNGVEFGLTPEEIVTAFKENNIKLKPNYAGVFPENGVDDGRSYNTANFDFAYILDDDGLYSNGYPYKGGYYYYEDGTISEFGTNRPDFSTNEGLKMGDDFNRMVEVYGEYYYHYVNTPRVYSYFNGNEYLFLSIDPIDKKIKLILFRDEDDLIAQELYIAFD